MTALHQHPARDEKKKNKKRRWKRRWMPWCTSCLCFNPSEKTSSSSYSFLLRLTKVKETLTEKNKAGGGKPEKGLRQGFFGKSTDYVRLSEHAVIFLRELFLKATKKSRGFHKDSKPPQQHKATTSLPPRPRSPAKPDLHRSNSSTVESTPTTLTVISPELHQIKATTTSSGTLDKEEIITKVSKSDTMVGLSVLTIILLVLGSNGRGLAIILTSALFYLISSVKTIPIETAGRVEEKEGDVVVDCDSSVKTIPSETAGRVEEKEGDVVVDCDSEEYKKKAVLECLLERKNRR